MPKKKSKKDKDFQKVKFKVGKKLPKAENVTSTAFRSRAIVIKEQLKETTTDDLRQDILKKSRNPQELLAHLQHYNASFRLNSLNTIKAIMISDPHKLSLYMGSVIDRVSALMSDKERDIRAGALECLKSIFNHLNTDTVAAFIPTIIAHLGCSMTYLTEDVKLDSLQFLDLLVSKYPQTLRQDLFKLTHNFLDLISTSSGRGKRTLKVSPNSKMSTVKWRQQAFAHLENLLSIGVSKGSSKDAQSSLTRSSLPMMMDCEDSSVIVHCADSPSTSGGLLSRTLCNGMYISISGLEEIVVRHSGIHEIKESDILQSFIGEVVPLLRETWVELIGSDGSAEGDMCTTLLSVVHIVLQLSQMINSSDIKDTQPVLKLLQTEVAHFIGNGFPILNNDRKSSKGRRSKETKKTNIGLTASIPSAMVLNLRICSLASVLGCTNKATRSYMLEVLDNTSVEELGDYLDVILLSIESGEMLDGFIVNMLDRQQMHHSQVAVILNIVNKQLCGSQRLNQETGNALIALVCRPEIYCVIQNYILTTINKACLRRKFTLEIASFLPVFRECINRQIAKSSVVTEDDSMVTAAGSEILKPLLTLLHHIDEVSIEILRSLTDLIWGLDRISLDVIEIVLNILHARTPDQGLPMDRYLSFLFTLIGGSSVTNTNKHYKLQSTQLVVRAVLHHIQLKFPNIQQVINLMEYFYRKMLNENGFLPFLTCSALIEASYVTKDISAEFVSDILICYMKYMKSKTTEFPHKKFSEHFTEESLKATLKTCSKLRPDVQEITLKTIISEVIECSDNSELELYTQMAASTIKCHWQWDVPEQVRCDLQQTFGVEDLQQLVV